MLASPPCPPWVVANSSPGFNRADGLTFLGMVECIAWVRPRIVVIEEVATIMKHEQWPVILAMIRWANYRVHHNRNRCIMILPCTDHVFEKWPISMTQSLRTYKAILRESSFWHDTVVLSKHEFDMYDVQLLPKDATIGGHAKRASRDLQAYRYRSVDQTAACFMTSYGRPCEVDASLLQKGGLYGSLLQVSGVIREFATPEIIFLQGAVDRCWVSCNIREAMKILGNSISVPHSTWGLVNAVKMIYPDPLPKSVENLFLDIIGDRMHTENFEFSLFDGGYLFLGKSEQEHDDPIDSTQAMLDFAYITVTSPMQAYCFVCAQDTPIFHALCSVLGASIPQKLELEPVALPGKRLPLTPDITTGVSDVKVITGVPSKMILHDKAFRQHHPDVQVVCVLTSDHCIILPRKDCMLVSDVSIVLYHFRDVDDSTIIFRDLGGNMLEVDDMCPDALFALNCGASSVQSIIHPIGIRFVRHHLIFHAITTVDDIRAFLNIVKVHGVLDFIRAIGWDFQANLAYLGSSQVTLTSSSSV